MMKIYYVLLLAAGEINTIIECLHVILNISAIYMLCLSISTQALTQNHFEIIRHIISWVLQFIRENISAWIRQQGGWVGSQRLFV